MFPTPVTAVVFTFAANPVGNVICIPSIHAPSAHVRVKSNTKSIVPTIDEAYAVAVIVEAPQSVASETLAALLETTLFQTPLISRANTCVSKDTLYDSSFNADGLSTVTPTDAFAVPL